MSQASLRTLIGVMLLVSSPLLCAAGVESLLPKPQSIHVQPGEFTLETDTLKVHNEAGKSAQLANEYLALRLGRIGVDVEGGKRQDSQLILIKMGAPKLAAEAYHIQVMNGQIQVRASDASGFLYAIMTLLQLGPDEVWNTDPKPAGFSIPCVIIQDSPTLALRGLMLDVSRQFYPKEFILELLDLLAQHKLNTFHWHLTDDEGWRIEIKSLPKLTEVGSVRGPGTKLPFSILPAIHGPKDEVQKGFYTQEDIREVVKRASELGITVIPEIDVPGHCKAAIVSYPELLQDPNDKSQYRSVQGTPNNTIDPGLESTYQFLDQVFAEVAELFPGQFIHVGGDERPGGAWEKSPAAQAMMKREGLNDTTELQSYFFRRVEAILKKYDKRMLGWQEVAYGGDLSRKDSAIMAWHDVGRAMNEVARQDIDVILSPASQTYLDLKYEHREDEPGLVWAGTTDTQDAYAYRPLSGPLATEERDHILGSIACLWSETVISLERADYMLWPRLCAFAEVTWADQEALDWNGFNSRLHLRHLPRLERQEVAYRVPQPSGKFVNDALVITPPYPDAQVHFTLDGSTPTVDSPVYDAPIILTPSDQPKFATFTSGSRHSRIVDEYERPPAAAWTPQLTPAEFTDITLPIAPPLSGPGEYLFTFLYEKGQHAINIESVSLLQSATKIATDTHPAFVGGRLEANVYRLSAPDAEKGAPASLLVRMKGDGGTDSQGRITMQFIPKRPSRSVTASQAASAPNFLAANASDGKEATLYRSKEHAELGDLLTVTFDRIQTASKVSVLTGFKDGKEQASSGILEISEDGQTWRTVKGLQYGNAEASFDPPIKVKAIRLRIDQALETPLVVREIDIESSP